MKHRDLYSHRMDAPDRHSGQRDASLCPSVRPSVCVLDGVFKTLSVLLLHV